MGGDGAPAVHKPTQTAFAPETVLFTVFISALFRDDRRLILRSESERVNYNIFYLWTHEREECGGGGREKYFT